jgi:dihydropteroate synthase
LEVAKQAIKAGAHIFNDIGCGNMDEGIFEWVGENNIPYVLSHSIGSIDEVHKLPNYLNIIEDVILELSEKVHLLRKLGNSNLIVDPGLGFSKTLDQNYQLLANLDQFQVIGAPILVGVSRKSMICKLLQIKPEEALNGSTALHMAALMKGANMLRVHDVKAAKEAIDLFLKLQEHGLSNIS